MFLAEHPQPRLWSSFELGDPDSLERSVVDAADACVCRWGWSKTTMADIASEAGISRTTVYRTYPGGRDVIFETLRRHRQLRFFHDLLEPLATGTSLESTMVDTMVLASVLLRDDEGFRTELVREPGLLLKQLTFEGLEQILGISRLVVVPQLTRFVDRREANRLAEWATRIVISHALDPSQHVDLTNRDHVEELVSRRRRRASPDLQQSNIRISESKD